MKRPLGKPRCRWEDVRMNLMEIKWEGVDWVYLIQNTVQWQAVLNMVMKLWVP
jgi:hypothetical protein